MAYTTLFLCQFEISILFQIEKMVVFKNIFFFISYFFLSTYTDVCNDILLYWYLEITTMICIKSWEATPLGFFCLTKGHSIYLFSPTQLPRVLTDWYLVSRYYSETILCLYLLQLWLLTAKQWTLFTESAIRCLSMVTLTSRISFVHIEKKLFGVNNHGLQPHLPSIL